MLIILFILLPHFKIQFNKNTYLIKNIKKIVVMTYISENKNYMNSVLQKKPGRCVGVSRLS